VELVTGTDLASAALFGSVPGYSFAMPALMA